MSAQDRYTKIIESLVNGEEAKASDLLHEAFVEKAREIWTDLVEQDELSEEEVEDLDESMSGDFEDDIEDAAEGVERHADEIETEEAFGEAEEDEDEMLEPEAEMELAGDEDMDFDADGEIDDHEGEHADLEDKMVSVEDALADLKAEFAKLMGEEEAEEGEEDFGDDEGMEVEFGGEEEEEELQDSYQFESDDEDLDEEVEELDEAAELKKVGADRKIHPVDMPNGEDGKASPAIQKPAAMGGDLLTIGKGGKEAGGKVKAPKQMTGFKHPGEGAALNKMSKGHGVEKKGVKPAKPSTDSMINKAPGTKK